MLSVGCASEQAQEEVTDDGDALKSLPSVYCSAAAQEASVSDCVLPDSLMNSSRTFFAENPFLYEMRGGHKNFSTTIGYYEHSLDKDLKVSSAKFIDAITTTPPKELWNDSSSYEMTYDRNTGKIYSKSDVHPPIAKGMVFVLRLKLAPLIFIPVAFEIVELNPAQGRFAFSYVIQNKSQGIQRLSFNDTATGSHVLHETRYLSGADFRDRHLYVPFHEKLVSEFYEVMDKRLRAAQ